MIVLIISESPEYVPVLVASNPDSGLIARTISQLPWEDITYVELRRDDSHALEVSGSLQDGFSAKRIERGKELLREPPPDSIAEMVELMQSYSAGTDAWRQGTWE